MECAMSTEAALAIVATEWFKTQRRLSRLTQDATPDRIERERAQLAYTQRRVQDALAQAGMRLVLYDGLAYSPSIPAEPANPEDFETEEGLVVLETIEPTIVHNGRVLARGRVVLAMGQ